MTQEFVTLPRDVMEQVRGALAYVGAGNSSTNPNLAQSTCRQAIWKLDHALRAALEQPQNHVPDVGNMVPAGWKLVPVESTEEMLRAGCGSESPAMLRESLRRETDGQKTFEMVEKIIQRNLNSYRAMLAAAPQPPALEQQVEKESTCKDSLQVEQKPDAWLHSEGKAQPLYLHPQPRREPLENEPAAEHKLKDVRCECCGYMTHHREHMGCIRAAHTKRGPLADQQIDAIAESMPGGLDGFLKGWGWRQFARAVLEAAPQPPALEQQVEKESTCKDSLQVEQEPYAWHYTNNGGASAWHMGPSNRLDADMDAAKAYPKVHRVTPLYTQPQPRIELTGDEARRIYNSATYSASLAVFMTRIDAEHPDADDKGVSGWLQEAEDRVKHRTIDAAHEIGQAAAPQQVEQEPVATLHCTEECYVYARATDAGKRIRFEQPIDLYTHPQPKREPLTHYEIHELFRRSWDDCQDGDEIKAFARAIEAAHGIK